MANVPAAGPANLDPQAAIQKHAAITQSGAAGDQAIITRIETSIRNSPMGWLQAQFGEVNSRASSEQGQINSKVSEQKELVASNQKDAPPDAGSAPTLGAPTRPAVSQPSTAKGGAVQPKGGAAAAGPTKGAKVEGKGVPKGAPAGHAATPGGIAGQMAGAQNDAQLDGMLNAYNPKGQQATEMIGRIKQMGSVAEGFRGQLDVYVAQGAGLESMLAGAANFFGVGKDASAVWATNPYRKMHGFLGGVMTGLSSLKSVTGLVGSICGKLGLVLTVVGLLGMIFPPIGAAVSGIARILNVVGMICEAISFVLSGILTGLNGVVLAKQIASGATAEEKAATADLMMSEANAAAGGLINLAMTFGPKFMKGLTAGSRGVISSLIRRFKAVVGRVSLRLTGNVKNFANRIVRRLGFGGAKMTRSGGAWVDKSLAARVGGSRVAKVFNSAPKVIDSIQNKLMTKYGNTAWAKRLDRVGAWSGAAAKKFDIEEKVGAWGESAGKRIGGLGANTKFGKSLAKAADASERETREAAMKIAQRDAIHLEETRWRNQKQIQNASPENANKVIDKHTSAVAKKHQDDFNLSEKNLKKTERAALRDEQKFGETNDKYWENDKKGGGTYRDEYMDKVHKSREKRWKLEEKHRVSDEQRKKLLEIEKRSPVEEKELTKLNQKLKNLDQARTTNLSRETELSKMSGLQQREVHNWKDVGSNVWSAVDPAMEMMNLKDNSKWQDAEKTRLLKWNHGDAAGTARARGGAGEYAEIKANQQRAQAADFAAFVQLGRPTATVAQATRSMLSSINRTPSAAPKPTAAPTAAPTPAPTPSPSPAASTASPVASSMPAASSTPTASSTPAAPAASTSAAPTAGAQTPGPAGATPAPATPALSSPMPAPVPEGDEGGGEPLPYWPGLLPEFDKAMTDFGFMRKIATEFKKAQIEGKQKAVETLAVYGRYEEYAKKRQEQAKANQTASQQTHANTQENSGAAGQANAQAGQGEAKQGEAKGAANSRAAVDLPEPETRGFWGRILGAVKRWARNKAAQIFGWIQEKIASVILRGLCGVSMGDLREYGGALRRQQQSAGQVATGAVQRSGTAAQQNVKLSADASKESQGAADAIGECDKNIVEADQFMGDVTSFEAQLTQEKAHAQAFLGQVHAAVHAEQARKKAEAEQQAQQEAAEAQRQQQAAQGEGEGGDENGPMPSPGGGGDADGEGADPNADSDQDGMPDSAEAEAAKAQIVAAADFVKDSAARMEIQVQGRAEDYQNQLVLALTNRTGDDAQGNDLEAPAKKASKHILDEFKAFVDETKQEMGQFRGMSIDPASAGRIADTVIAQAEHLDTNYNQSMEALDELFERTYTGIRDGRRDLQTRVLGGDNVVGHLNQGANDLTDRTYDAVSPTMNAAWDTVSTPIRQAPLPAAPDSSAVQGPGLPPSGPSQ